MAHHPGRAVGIIVSGAAVALATLVFASPAMAEPATTAAYPAGAAATRYTDIACRTAVLKYLSAWTKELHRLGYVSGVYANLSSGALDLSDTCNSTSYARPDALWIARYDGNSLRTGWAGIADSKWAVHQRAKQ